MSLFQRINLHRRAKSGCKYVIKHFKDVCVSASFLFQIIEVFPGTGYKKNKRCSVDRETILDREDSWIETPRTSCPYGLNKTKRKLDSN